MPAAKTFILLNQKSGRHEQQDTEDKIAAAMKAAQREYELILIADASRLQAVAKETMPKVLACDGTLVIAGGDGAINAVVQAVAGSGCRFGVLPHGTFNYFSRTHDIPSNIEQALQVLIHGEAELVQTGLVNDRVFLVNASIGLYPRLLQDREANKRKYGRSRFIAFLSGILTIFSRHRQMRLTLEQQGQTKEIVTQTLFVGNNALQMQQVGIPMVDAIEKDHLAAVVLKPVSRISMLGLLLRGLLGKLGEADSVDSFSFRNMSIKSSRLKHNKRIKVATDGEILWMQAPLVFRAWPQSLLLIKPNTAQLAQFDKPE